MDTTTLVLSSLAKIVFVLAILFTFAPLMVWAERRQSAMMQDRIGPIRAGIPVPDFAKTLASLAGQGAMAVAALTAFFAITMIALKLLLPVVGTTDVGLVRPGWNWAADLSWWWIAAAVGAAGLHYPLGKLLPSIVSPQGTLTAWGLLHPLADALKMVWKEDFVPPNADKLLHAMAPIVALVPALATFAVIPFADPFYLDWATETLTSGKLPGAGSVMIPMQVASLNVGILYVFAIAGTGVVGAAIAGYSSDNKYSLLGGLRAAGQMVSYEVTLGLSLVGSFMVYDSLLLDQMVNWQKAHVWGIFAQPLGFFLFFAASTAEAKRVPFDVPEGESEIVGGYFTEYSGMKFGMFMTGEFIEVVTSSALLVTIFLGGYHVPFLDADGFRAMGWVLPMPHVAVIGAQVAMFVLKLVAFVFLQLQIRWTLPRFRYDQIMKLCWRFLLPLSLFNILATGVAILLLE